MSETRRMLVVYPLFWCTWVLASDRGQAQCQYWQITQPPAPNIRDLEVFDPGAGASLFVATEDAVVSWTGAWGPGWGFDNTVHTLGTYDDGTGLALYAGGEFLHGPYAPTPPYAPIPLKRIAKLVGGTWTQVGPAGPPLSTAQFEGVHCMAAFDDGTGSKLYVGGVFQSFSPSILVWDGAAWSGVGGGIVAVPSFKPAVARLCTFDDGSGSKLYVGGYFLGSPSLATTGIMTWDGTSWGAVGGGVTWQGGPGGVGDMVVFDPGTGPALYVSGGFDHAGGVPAPGLARWDGTNWTAVPNLGANIGAQALAVHDDGNGPALYALTGGMLGQGFVLGVARWDGSSWSALGGGYSGTHFALQSYDDGQGGGPALYVGGYQGVAGGNLPSDYLVRWQGTCSHRIDPLCFGDGSFAACPCANYGASQHGCRNSASMQGALLSHSGNLHPDSLVLRSTGEPATSLSLFLQSQSLRPVPSAFGDGILCLGERILRLYAKPAAAGVVQAPGPGDPSLTQRSALLGDPIAPGSVRYYQVWYRDGNSSFCPSNNFNVTNGQRVVW